MDEPVLAAAFHRLIFQMLSERLAGDTRSLQALME